MTEYIVKFDGASRGNPGPATSAGILYKDGIIIESKNMKHPIPLTNNQAEYIGCLFAVELAVKHNVKNIKIQGDSQLIIYQLCGKYKCKNDKLIIYYNQIKDLIKKFDKIEYQWIPRELNKDADGLCNQCF